jgi:hypothetical protein
VSENDTPDAVDQLLDEALALDPDHDAAHWNSPSAAWPETYLLGISATSPDAARAVLETWSAGGPGWLECALAGAPVH